MQKSNAVSVNFSMFNNPLHAIEAPTEEYKQAIIKQAIQRPGIVRVYESNGHRVTVYEPATAQGAYFGKVRESRRNSRRGAE